MIDLGEIGPEEPPAPRPRVVRAWLARHKRWVAAGSALFLLAISLYAVLPGLLRREPTPQPSPTPMKRIEGFPEYANGARVVAAASAPLAATEAALTWTVTELGVTIFDRCEFLAADGTQLKAQFMVSGDVWWESSCGPDGGTGASRYGAEAWTTHGIEIGDTVRITMRIGGATRFDAATQKTIDAETPHVGTIGVAIGVPVPFEEYPLPARPSTLPVLQLPVNGDGGDGSSRSYLRSDADALEPITVDLVWGSYDLSMSSATPGALHVTIDGVTVTDCEIWSYEGDSCGLGWTIGDPHGFDWQSQITARPGETVRLTITPTHVTGPWGVRITRS
ncbi:hypothetical protein HDA40_003163 [Hamadaea flava]|uniref:Uncharacterized protein n=1 Tax=Hamadaea flava TaxID=1742688 RepID=A0ABV8LWK9_9ACTN|nr:hypothetical protein [Hamadaea flava]MCP2324656.1 hypothetical protein [Hamadaea flava]